MKYIPPGCEGCYLTLGGEERAVYEYYNNAYWGRGPQIGSGFVTLGTFSALFPKGKYFGEADLNGPSNSIDVLPNFWFNIANKLRCTTIYSVFWRESLHDGMYSFATNLERSGLESTSRFEGQQAEIDFDLALNAHALTRVV